MAFLAHAREGHGRLPHHRLEDVLDRGPSVMGNVGVARPGHGRRRGPLPRPMGERHGTDRRQDEGREPRIAGRQVELAALRRHLEGGDGLVLVVGEAGIGKSVLVESARSSTDIFVAIGHCLPLSAAVPLMPIADALRTVAGADDGRWLDQALTHCRPYVTRALAPLLPELSPMLQRKPPGSSHATACSRRSSKSWGRWLGYGPWPCCSRTCTGPTCPPWIWWSRP